MKMIRLFVVFLFVAGGVFANAEKKAFVLSHTDAVVVLATGCGFFDQHLAELSTV